MNMSSKMSKSIPIVFALSILCGVLSSAVADQDATAELFNLFNQLLSESGMEFTPPEGFTTVPVQSNPLFPYEHAIHHQSRRRQC